MPTNYCCKYNNIWDSTTRRYRCCKNKACHGHFCTIHYRLLYTYFAITIQKMYKGYYIRKKLKIYYNLPRDLQRKIIWYINSDLYLRNFNSSISKIIYRRYTEFYKKYSHLISTNTVNIIPSNTDFFIEVYIDLVSLLKLSIKYYPIIKINNIPYFKKISYLSYKYEMFYRLNNPKDINYLIFQRYNLLFN